MLEFLQRGVNCPSVIETISAPLLGHNLRIIGMQMGLRSSHLRGFSVGSPVGNKVLIMINPVIQPE